MRCVATQEIGPPSSVSAPQTAKKYSSSQRHLVRAVRVQPVVSHADAEAGGHPVEENRGREQRPTEEEQGGDRSHVKERESNGRRPVRSLAPRQTDNFSLSSCPPDQALQPQTNRDLADSL